MAGGDSPDHQEAHCGNCGDEGLAFDQRSLVLRVWGLGCSLTSALQVSSD